MPRVWWRLFLLYPSFSGAGSWAISAGTALGQRLKRRFPALSTLSIDRARSGWRVGPILSSLTKSRSFDLQLAPAIDECQSLRRVIMESPAPMR